MNEKEWEKLNEEQQSLIKEICEYINDPTMQEMFSDFLAKERELLPHIKAELKKARKDPEINNLTVFEVLDAQIEKNARKFDAAASAPGMTLPPKSKALIILEKALRRQALMKKYPAQPNYDIKSISVINNTLVNYLQDRPIIGAGPFDLPVMTKKDITAYTTISFEDDTSDIYAGIENISEFERAVLDRIYSLKKYADNIGVPCLIDGYTIAGCMPGAAGKTRPHEAAMYNEIIEKFRHLFINVDATDEMRERGAEIPEGDKFILNDYCISAIGAEYRTKQGDIKPGYILRDIPLPHKYAEQTNQIITISADLFDIKETLPDASGKLAITDNNISMTQTRQNMVNYLLRRIYIIKNDFAKAKELQRKYEAKRSKQAKNGGTVDEYKPIKDFCKIEHKIKFDTVFEKSGVIDPSKTEAARLRNFSADALNYWQAKGIIKDYEIVTGKAAHIKIILEK